MRRAWLVLVLLVPAFSGCLSGDPSTWFDDEPDREIEPMDPGYDAGELRVTGVATHDLTINAGDVDLDAVLYEPLTTDSIDGEDAVWPVVVFVHPWGFPKETYENAPLSVDGRPGPPNTNLMQRFAEHGIMTVGYDARGWYQSAGQTSVAGPAEMRDLRAVIDYVNDNHPSSGHIGVTGVSYGGGHAFRAWQDFDDVVTVVPHQGWVDLYEGIMTGNTPKLEWAAALVAVGVVGTQGTIHGDVGRWMAAAATRQSGEDMDGVRADMDIRSVGDAVDSISKPIFICQGLQETLFPQSHLAWQNAAGFARAHYYTGGHNTLDGECWDKTLDWFLFFLAGVDTEVDAWPAVTTIDANGETWTHYSDRVIATSVTEEVLHLREGKLVEYDAPNFTFIVSQRLAANPIHEPNVVWDSTGMPYQMVPAQFRQDPSAVFFESAATTTTGTLLGAPSLTLDLAEGTGPSFQIVGTLYHASGGSWRILGRTAYSALHDAHVDDGTVTLDFPWVKADFNAGDQFVLKLGGNDPTMFTPLLANYDAAFTGASSLHLPIFDPPAHDRA